MEPKFIKTGDEEKFCLSTTASDVFALGVVDFDGVYFIYTQ